MFARPHSICSITTFHLSRALSIVVTRLVIVIIRSTRLRSWVPPTRTKSRLVIIWSSRIVLTWIVFWTAWIVISWIIIGTSRIRVAWIIIWIAWIIIGSTWIILAWIVIWTAWIEVIASRIVPFWYQSRVPGSNRIKLFLALPYHQYFKNVTVQVWECLKLLTQLKCNLKLLEVMKISYKPWLVHRSRRRTWIELRTANGLVVIISFPSTASTTLRFGPSQT